MNSIIKKLAGLIVLAIAIYFIYLFVSEDRLVIIRDTLPQIELHEGPHIVYGKEQTHLITGVPADDKMALKIENIERPTKVEVFKPGKPEVRFTVPIRQNIVTPPVTHPKPEKLFAISDVEGNFNTVTNMLKLHKVIDDQLNWSFGKGHLVIIGDVFDRGNHVTELLWLIYRLEGEAQSSGGDVHMLIGNHEMLVLQNDLRYAESKYYKFGELLQEKNNMIYADMFQANTELGKWLRSKNIIEKIGDTLFTHGGISPKMSEGKLSLEAINQTMRAAIDIPKKERPPLEKLLFGRNGPMWYRGYFMSQKNSPKIDKPKLTEVLDYYGAKSIAVGHTIVDKPELRFDGQVIAVDVKHPADHLITIPARTSYGVLFNADGIFVVDGDGGVENLQ